MAEIENPYLVAFLELETKRRRTMRWDSGFSPTKEDVDFIGNYWRTRESLRHKYAYAIFSQAELELIKSHSDKLVSIGAGTGYVEYLLSQVGCEVIAYDEKPYSNHWSDGNFYPVAVGLPEVAANHPDHALFLCWPPYASPMASNVYWPTRAIWLSMLVKALAWQRQMMIFMMRSATIGIYCTR